MPPLMCRLATSASCGGRKSERVDAALGQEKVGGVRRLRFERGERQRARDWVLVATTDERALPVRATDFRRSTDPLHL